jgi:hypothetical protein
MFVGLLIANRPGAGLPASYERTQETTTVRLLRTPVCQNASAGGGIPLSSIFVSASEAKTGILNIPE